MDDFSLLDLFFGDVPDDELPEEVVQAHELLDSEREPYVEDYEPNPLYTCYSNPWLVRNDSYTVY